MQVKNSICLNYHAAYVKYTCIYMRITGSTSTRAPRGDRGRRWRYTGRVPRECRAFSEEGTRRGCRAAGDG